MGTVKPSVTKKNCPLTKKGVEGMFLGPGWLGGDTTVKICCERGAGAAICLFPCLRVRRAGVLHQTEGPFSEDNVSHQM